MEGLKRSGHTFKEVLTLAGKGATAHLNGHCQRVLGRIRECRGPNLGYHLYRCSDQQCGALKYQYHSCRDRHCPMCGALKKEEWIEARTRELLPVPYYHVVFTLPHELNSLVMGNRRALYKLLFDASAATLLSFAKDPQWLGAVPGIISVLHTWGQQLSFHPHVHCIVSGGGISSTGKWVEGRRTKDKFLFPVKAMAIVYRAKFLEGLKALIGQGAIALPDGFNITSLMGALYRKVWVVYAKRPFGGPGQVIEYLGRYTHKVAISNHRIERVDRDKRTVSFGYKDYADGSTKKQMTLTAAEFVRRFATHILPKGFTKIRSYGYLANRGRQGRIEGVLKSLGLPLHPLFVKVPTQVLLKERFGVDVGQCPCCGKGRLELVLTRYFTKGADDG